MLEIAGEEGRLLSRDASEGGRGTEVERWIRGGGVVSQAVFASVVGYLVR